MKINYVSDLHLEFGGMETELEGGDVLVLAGDINIKSRVDWINSMAAKYNHVIYVLGNHEFYRGTLNGIHEKTRGNLANNVHLLENESITIKALSNSSILYDDVTFHGATLWSDFLNGDPISYLQCAQAMTDYRIIRAGDGQYKFTPQIAHSLHVTSRMFLQENVKKGDVVVTHMAPSLLSIHEKYKHDMYINGAYASDLSELILNTKPKLWFHGHMHNSFDYTIGDTRILCNPRGYVGEELNSEFDPNACVHICDMNQSKLYNDQSIIEKTIEGKEK